MNREETFESWCITTPLYS